MVPNLKVTSGVPSECDYTGSQGKFLASPVDGMSTEVHLNRGLKRAFLSEERSLLRVPRSTTQFFSPLGNLFLFFSLEKGWDSEKGKSKP